MFDIEQFKRFKEVDYLYNDVANDFLNVYNYKMVPRVISLIDMDAFFAQVCHVKYNIPRNKPLAVIHNNTVLAVNYPSREKGINRKMSKDEILSLCPEIIIPQNIFLDVRGKLLELFHNEEEYNSYSNESNNQQTINNEMNYQKLSLDIFRKASRMIFSKLKSYLPTCNSQIASIDEIYFDLTETIRKMFNSIKNYLSNKEEIYFNFDQLKSEICINEINANLMVNKKDNKLDFDTIIKVLFPELYNERIMSNIVNCSYTKDNVCNINNLTFEEMCLIFGSIIIYRARKRLEEETTYTCSSGIYMNKIYSKMISSLNKPNGQTVLLHRWFESYIKNTHILKLRFLGGKLGKNIVEKFPEIETIKDLQKLSIKQLINNFGERTGLYLYNSSRGIDDEIVGNDQERNNSLQSSKIFTTPLYKLNQIENWLKIFSCELFYRNQSNYKISKKSPRKITVKIKCKDNIIRARSGDLIYNSELPSKCKIFESSRNIILNKFEKNLFPCKFLGISLNCYKRCDRNDDISKIEFNKDKTNITNDSNLLENLLIKDNSNNNNSGNLENFTCILQDDEFLQFDNVLMDAINDDIFQNNDFLIKSENVSGKELKYIYKNWPFVIKDSKINSLNKNQVNSKFNSKTPSNYVNKRFINSKLTNYKQTKLKFTLHNQ